MVAGERAGSRKSKTKLATRLPLPKYQDDQNVVRMAVDIDRLAEKSAVDEFTLGRNACEERGVTLRSGRFNEHGSYLARCGPLLLLRRRLEVNALR